MEEKIGVVEDFFAKISVIAVKLEGELLKIGDKIHIKGHTTDFIQTVESIRIEHQKVNFAKKGDSLGIKVEQRYHKSDVVYKIAE
jgi:translation elongation factor EF-1alpha